MRVRNVAYTSPDKSTGVAFYDVTEAPYRGYDWELWTWKKVQVEDPWHLPFQMVEKLGSLQHGETMEECARRLGVEPSYMSRRKAEEAAAEAREIEKMRNQTRRVTQRELDFLGGVEAYRRDIEPYRKLEIVEDRRLCGVVL